MLTKLNLQYNLNNYIVFLYDYDIRMRHLDCKDDF